VDTEAVPLVFRKWDVAEPVLLLGDILYLEVCGLGCCIFAVIKLVAIVFIDLLLLLLCVL
jgi:hypothetical protein